MRKVVDKNYIELPLMEDYLKKDNHYVILTDFFMVETLKGKNYTNLFKTFKIVSKYPNKVFILKNMRLIINYKSKNLSGMQRKLIDDKQSSDFSKICKVLYSDLDDNEKIKCLRLSDKKDLSNDFINSNINNIDKLRKVTYDLCNEYSRKQLDDFFTIEKYDASFANKIAKSTTALTMLMLNRNHMRIDDFNIAKNNYYFRFSLAMTILLMQWIFNSKHINTKDQKLNNDIIDMTYVALATFFDGILTNDLNVKFIYKRVNALISKI